MSYIDDILINGQQSSSSIQPTVGGIQPLITWDYVTDIAAQGQKNVQIQIGESDEHWGSDLFDGSILDININTSSNYYQYENFDLNRGSSYYGQIQITDENNEKTIWSQFSFKVNKLPVIFNYYLSPTNPSSKDDIEVEYLYYDEDNHDQSGTKIRWYKDNIPVPQYDDLCVLPSSATNPSETWTAKVIPSDGLEYGIPVETQPVIIEQVNSYFENIEILPKTPNIDDLLKVVYEISDDEYLGFVGEVSYEWYINDELVNDSNKQIIRLDTNAGDIIFVKVILTQNGSIISSETSGSFEISDSQWNVSNLLISSLSKPTSLVDLSPIIEWTTYKSRASINEKPNYLRVLITKTPSINESVHDTGFVAYTKDSYIVPDNILLRGQKYYFHVVISDSLEPDQDLYKTVEVQTAGSSWSSNVSNEQGWTIEFKGGIKVSQTEVTNPTKDHNIGIYIHDGKYFCSVIFGLRNVTFVSDTSIVYTYKNNENPLVFTEDSGGKTFRICAKNNNVRIFMNNRLIIDGIGLLTNQSNLKLIEYGDIDPKNTNIAQYRFFRYSTQGAYGLDSSLEDENSFYFSKIGKIEGGSIDSIFGNLIAWSPDDDSLSSKLVQFNENAQSTILPTVNKNYSPITSIYIDNNRNKFLGTANGVIGIYGEKHDPDYEFTTSQNNINNILSNFDRISNVSLDKLPLVEPILRQGWFTIDTTYRSIGTEDINSGFETGDPYDPYKYSINSHAIHYYTQRTPGQPWFDQVDNSKGWQISFSFDLSRLEADDFIEQNLDKTGFGVYVNDGTYQEILYFYSDRIRLFHSNYYVPISTTVSRDYVITAKENNIFVYQKVSNSPTSNYSLLIDGSGIFNTHASQGGNSKKPKIVLDSKGFYHAVWHDDGKRQSQLMYSFFNGQQWSNPELVTSSAFSLRNVSIDVDGFDRIWVAYEDTSWGQTEISVSVKNETIWNPRIRITNHKSNKQNPDIKLDIYNNAHLVWEDDRDGLSKIFWASFDYAKQAWISSAWYGADTPIMQHDPQDPYQSSGIVFKHGRLVSLQNYMWLVAEGSTADGDSYIFRGYYDINQKWWNSSGFDVIINDEFVSTSSSDIISDANYVSTKPEISASHKYNEIIVVWESFDGVSKSIAGTSFNKNGQALAPAQNITDSIINSNNPTVGFLLDSASIVFERNKNIYTVAYSPISHEFFGSNNGYNDSIVDVGTKNCENPSVSQFTQSNQSELVFDYKNDRTSASLDIQEFPDFSLIGSTLIENEGSSFENSETSNVSNLDNKEFAFGDFSENVGMIANYKNISMYFGYDAKPYNIQKFNQSTIQNWTDNRINDLFIDAFGNIIAASHNGLLYYNTSLNSLTRIQGRTDDFSNTCSPTTCLLDGALVTTVRWGKNGVWYVGTAKGAFCSKNAGKTWQSFFPEVLANKIIADMCVNKYGEVIIATITKSAGRIEKSELWLMHPSFSNDQIKTVNFDAYNSPNIKKISIDDADIIWCATDYGLFRVENFSQIMSFSKKDGMRSSFVNDVAVVNKHLRYIATATGIERMNGTKFVNINVQNTSLLNDNISKITWDNTTNSLWVTSLHVLHEIVFRDTAHKIIENEVIHYTSEIGLEENYTKDTYYILDYVSDLTLSKESSSVLINKNKLDFGFSLDSKGQYILFDCDLLPTDQVEIEISQKFSEFHDFNQSQIEKNVIGHKRTLISKMDRTASGNQLLILTTADNPGISVYAGQYNLPFDTIVIDSKPPEGCLELVDILTKTRMKFRILASDDLSGVDSYMVSNYPNFTTDGESPQDFEPFKSIIDHDIGSTINNVFDSLTFPNSTTIGTESFTVGTGSATATWNDESNNNIEYLYSFTNTPCVVFRYAKAEDLWSSIGTLDYLDNNQYVTDVKTFNNIIYVTTGTSVSGNGKIYKITNGTEISIIGSVIGFEASGICSGIDGTIYFGSSSGNIYEYKSNNYSIKYSNIGDRIYSLDVYENFIFVGTGNQGRIYSINLSTDENLIIFDHPSLNINNVHIKDNLITQTPEKTHLFVSSGDFTDIYRAIVSDLSFVKSYSSFGKKINKIKTIENIALNENEQPSSSTEISTSVVAAIGNDLFKFNNTAWEFLYKHEEEIKDFVQFESSGVEGVWIVSASKVTKWTPVLSEKNVYLKLKDKAGNISNTNVSTECPNETNTCCGTYSIKIEDLKDFINEARIVEIDEYGSVSFTYNSFNKKSFFSADKIEQEIGIYTSEVLNGSNDLVSWKAITWQSNEPENTFVNLQIRSGVTEDELLDGEWSINLTKSANGLVSLEHITDQYLQFRAILTSEVRGISPSLTSVTIQNITTQASHFFTTNFVLPSKPVKGILTSNSFIPVSSDIVFGVNTKNSINFSDYQIIEPNRLFSVNQNQFGSNLRIGAKLLSPAISQIVSSDNPGDPYDDLSYNCNIEFTYENINTSNNFHFRVRLYYDIYRTQLRHTFFSGNDQTGWSTNEENTFPGTGIYIEENESTTVSFTPYDVTENQKWYITIDAWDGSDFETIFDNKSYYCSLCNINYVSGIKAEYYRSDLSGYDFDVIPSFAEITPDYILVEPNIDFDQSDSWISMSTSPEDVSDFSNNFAIRFKGKILAPVSGDYGFTIKSTDGSILYINGTQVIDHDGDHEFTQKNGSINIPAGFHDIEVQYYVGINSPGLILYWSLPGEASTVIPANKFFYPVTTEYCDDVSTPKIFNIAAEFILENGETVKINKSLL